MSSSTVTPQATTGTPSVRKQVKSTASKADTQTQKERQQKEKQAALSVLKKLLEADSQLYGASVEAILAYAENVLEARDELKGNGIPELHFDPWKDFKNQCKGGKSSVSKCITIAEHAAINDPKNTKYLPASLSTLYELTTMSVDKFSQAPKSLIEKDDTINPAMTREQARELAGKMPHPGKQQHKTALENTNNEDHLAAARALETKAQAANSPTPPAQEPEEVETLTTFPNVMNDHFFHFDLPVLEDRATAAIIRTRLTKLKADLPVPDGYVWIISLKKT